MSPLIIYSSVGIVVLVVLLLDSRIQRKKHRNAVMDYLDANDPNKRKLSYKVINKILAPGIGGALIIVFWPIALAYFGWDKIKNKKEDEEAVAQLPKEFAVSKDHLLEKLSRDEIEQREFIHDPLGAVPDLPFGHLNPAWLKFMDECTEGDTLWSFAAPWSGRWDQGPAETRRGYARVRRGMVCGFFITLASEEY